MYTFMTSKSPVNIEIQCSIALRFSMFSISKGADTNFECYRLFYLYDFLKAWKYILFLHLSTISNSPLCFEKGWCCSSFITDPSSNWLGFLLRVTSVIWDSISSSLSKMARNLMSSVWVEVLGQHTQLIKHTIITSIFEC